MKRSASLLKLSREHHVALGIALHIDRAADPAARTRLLEAFPRRFRNEQAELTGAYTITAEHVGRDPHFAHAEMFAVVAATKIDDKLHRIANVGSDAAEPALTAGMGDEG